MSYISILCTVLIILRGGGGASEACKNPLILKIYGQNKVTVFLSCDPMHFAT